MAVDAAAGTGSLRTLGTGAQQAAPGNDSRFTDGLYGLSTQPRGDIGKYDVSLALTFSTLQKWHALPGIATTIGALVGCSAITSKDLVITGVENDGGFMRSLCVGHGLSVNDYVTQVGYATAAQNAIAKVTSIEADKFTTDVAFSANEVGRVIRGSGLKFTANQTTIALAIQWVYLFGTVGPLKTYTTKLLKNKTFLDNIYVRQFPTTVTPQGSASNCGLVSLAKDDVLWMAIQNGNDNTAVNLVCAKIEFISLIGGTP